MRELSEDVGLAAMAHRRPVEMGCIAIAAAKEAATGELKRSNDSGRV